MVTMYNLVQQACMIIEIPTKNQPIYELLVSGFVWVIKTLTENFGKNLPTMTKHVVFALFC